MSQARQAWADAQSCRPIEVRSDIWSCEASLDGFGPRTPWQTSLGRPRFVHGGRREVLPCRGSARDPQSSAVIGKLIRESAPDEICSVIGGPLKEAGELRSERARSCTCRGRLEGQATRAARSKGLNGLWREREENTARSMHDDKFRCERGGHSTGTRSWSQPGDVRAATQGRQVAGARTRMSIR